jgi:signal peptidase I
MESRHSWMLLGAFVLGLLLAATFFTISGTATGFVVRDSINSQQLQSPSDTLMQDSILLFEDKVIIHVENASIESYQDADSMAPFLTNYSHGLRIHPKSESDIHVGDIVSFTQGNRTIVHRVVNIQKENNTIYFVTKGDNAQNEDARIVFSDIEWKIIGILY